ncbi:MAG: hypothetical protein A4E53_04329 [Pelotomaculum sp. PtaB.Bin104]|nr:MAG: hypothetical protein A4E53_04329 [Pelotomaculum sp. PtaB.Bin104]
MAFLPANNEVGSLGAAEITERARIFAGQLQGVREPRLITFSAGAISSNIKNLELLFEPGVLVPQIIILGGAVQPPIIGVNIPKSPDITDLHFLYAFFF